MMAYTKNIVERGPYIIQECKEVGASPLEGIKYALWHKNKREHVTRNGETALFNSGTQALNIANELIKNANSFIKSYPIEIDNTFLMEELDKEID